MKRKKSEVRRVFISSTSEDLKEYRLAARDAVIAAGCLPVMMEYFTPQGVQKPLEGCLREVEACEVIIAIVAHRYGWVPPDQRGGGGKSITWLECERAQEVFAFLVDEKAEWPKDRREAWRVSEAIENGSYTAELAEEVGRNVKRLREFKAWLSSIGFRGTFSKPDDLKMPIALALRAENGGRSTDASKYLAWLREHTGWIDIRGLNVGSGKAHRFPIRDLYTPLTTTKADLEESGAGKIGLEEALRAKRLVITGDPGSGKTTFLRRLAQECISPSGDLKVPDGAFPVLIRIGELEEHITSCISRKEQGCPATTEDPEWLLHYLESCQWDLDAEYFDGKLRDEATLVLLDGWDEAPNRRVRERMARLFENATKRYPKCRFVVTTRPWAYQDHWTPIGFDQVRIDDLSDEAVERFLGHWAKALNPSDAVTAAAFQKELLTAVRARPDVRRLARNPVMLTTLAVLQWNDRRLPEQRAELYESILGWLARAREKPGRERADTCLRLLGQLALGMQSSKSGRHTTIAVASQILADHFPEQTNERPSDRAAVFLEAESLDSGIIVLHGSNYLRFWHGAFQNYLAARAVASRSDAGDLLYQGIRLNDPNWLEVLALVLQIVLRSGGANTLNLLVDQLLSFAVADGSNRNRAFILVCLGSVLGDLQGSGYGITSELRSKAHHLADSVANDAFAELELSTQLELVDALVKLDLTDTVRTGRIFLPSSVLLDCALANQDERLGELAISALVMLHFTDLNIRSELIRIANITNNPSIRLAIRSAFEHEFPPWKRWLTALDANEVVPPLFAAKSSVMTLSQLRLKNIRSFVDTGVITFHPEGTLLVGDNAAGKSTLLRCIAVATLGPELANQIEPRASSYLRRGADSGAIEAAFTLHSGDERNDTFHVGIAIRRSETGFRAMPDTDMTLGLHNSAERLDMVRRQGNDAFGFTCGFGPFRTFSDPSKLFPEKSKTSLDRLGSLFDPHAPIIDPELAAKLLAGETALFRGAPHPLEPMVRNALHSHLSKLLPAYEEPAGERSADLILDGDLVRLNDVSDGYASMLALAVDIFRRALDRQGWLTDPGSISGIVLIDEIDAHLHPSWQRHVLRDLRDVFRNLQILATTHSPMVAASIDTSAILHVIRSERASGSHVRGYEMKLQRLEADAILTSPFFGLEDTRDVDTELEESRYDQLRGLQSPSQEELDQRRELARRLFGSQAELVESARGELMAAIEASLRAALESISPEEQTKRLIEAEAMIERLLAGGR